MKAVRWEIGNWGVVYLPGEAKDHHLDAYIRHDGEEIAHLGGIYLPAEEGTGSLSADIAFEHFPLNVANPFVPTAWWNWMGILMEHCP